MHLKRAIVAKNILIEFLPPTSPGNKVVIICDGMPSMPGKKALVKWFAKQGYWAINLRYRGTWESGGNFLDHDPVEDVWDVVSALDKPITDVWSQEIFHIQPKQVHVVGASFGGTAAILSTGDLRIEKAIALAPVLDWTIPSETEPMPWLKEVLKNGYPGAYRFAHKDWKKLAEGNVFQITENLDKIESEKLFVIWAQDDKVISTGSIQRFVHKVSCKSKKLRKGGHLGSRSMMEWRLRRSIKKFLRS